jgi:lipopolysaccharide/colanic/teichoic acid biosynthesis glycosyltransferase
MGLYRNILKRVFDGFVATCALILLSPLFVIVAVFVRLKLGSPVFFRQQRPGLNGKPFELVKFRTMTDARSGSKALLPDNERVTSFGRFLRSTSLDELPELWNVLKGEMSLVGPRPLRIEYLPLYTAKQTRRHEVLPGITGWAQVKGRNLLGWEQKFDLDLWYVNNHSFTLDIKILFLTIKKVILREGVNDLDNCLVKPFTGTNQQGG